MRIGIITDVHANIQALETVLRVLEEAKIDFLACLGDIVGYGGQPEVCCTLVRENADVTVVGNHDAAVAGRMDYDYYRPTARQALDTHRTLLSDVNLEWLQGLPYSARHGEMEFCHGVPPHLEAFEYLFAIDQVHQLVETYDERARVTFIGHSHLCKSFKYTAADAEEVLRTQFEMTDGKYIVSAGSVGQPRDYDSRACCAIFDSETGHFEYIRLPYDVEGAVRDIEAIGLAPAFGRRLLLGV